MSGCDLYDAWDARNKAAQRAAWWPTTFAEISAAALAAAYVDLGLVADAEDDMKRLHESAGSWPLWPDVAEGVREVAASAQVDAVGLLSNVDDQLARRTAGAALVDPDVLLTSQRLQAFKPDPAIYHRAAQAVAPRHLVHVAASARDVRGALEAGLPTVRLARPGHAVDADGPTPDHQVTDAAELAVALRALA